MYRVKIRNLESKDKKFLFDLFKASENDVERASFSMLGLDALSEDQLFTRMEKVGDLNIIEVNEVKQVGIIEVVPYEQEVLELRMAIYIDISGNLDVTKMITQQFIIDILQKYGAKRVILEISLKNDLVIKYLIKSGYKVISIINETMTLEFDYSSFNK